ncbi:MAG: hypothetical protein WD651_06605 [Acidimicrobiia bacterium]
MTTIASMIVELGVDDKELDKIPRRFDSLQRSLEASGKKMAATGQRMTVGLTLPILGAGVAAFKLASDVNESMSQVGTVFGEEAGNVISASENLNDAFSQADFLAYAGNLGDVAQGLGLAREVSDDMSLSVLSLSQDLSSFKNVPVDQAVNAITSALAGEREALKSLGIVLNDAMVKQKALEMGLYSGTGAIDTAAQAQATMALITEKSANAIGDFDRTSEGAANKTRMLMANARDLAGTLGQHLLPIGTAILSWLNSMAQKFGTLSPTMQKIIVVAGGIVAGIGPVLMVIGKLAIALGPTGALTKGFQAVTKLFSLNPWVLLIVATVALVTLIVMNWDKIVAFLKGVWDWITRTAGQVWEWLKGVFRQGLDFIKNLFLNWTAIGLIIKHWDKIKAAAMAVKDWIVDKFNAVVTFFKTIPQKIGQALANLRDLFLAPFKAAFNAVASLWNNTLGKISFTVPSWVPFMGGKGFAFPKIPTFHEGGIVPGRLGEDVLIRAQAGEKVTPAGESGGVIIQVQGVSPDPVLLADAIAWRMRTAGV